MKSSGKLVIPVFISHRGCPHQCLFCNQHSIAGKGLEKGANHEDIDEVITTWLNRSFDYNDVQVAFYGGSFTCLPADIQIGLLTKVQPYLLTGRVHSIRLSTRPDCIDKDIVGLLKEYGVNTVELGVQSLSDAVLQKSRRGHTADQSRQAVKLLKDNGFETGVQLLPGLPGETSRSFFAGVKEVIRLSPDLVRLYPAVVVRRSGLEELYRNGSYAPLTLNKAIALVRRAKELFDEAKIPVVRMGLQPSDSLNKELVAGPFHPAFGELIQSREWFAKIRKKLASLKKDEHLNIHISLKDQSAIIGNRRKNIERLEQLGYKGRFTIFTDRARERGAVSYVVNKSS